MLVGCGAEAINAQEIGRIGEGREENGLTREREWRDRADRHERELLQVAARKALRVAERLIEFERSLIAAREVTQPIQLATQCQFQALD